MEKADQGGGEKKEIVSFRNWAQKRVGKGGGNTGKQEKRTSVLGEQKGLKSLAKIGKSNIPGALGCRVLVKIKKRGHAKKGV